MVLSPANQNASRFWDKPSIRQFFREQGNWPELRIRNCQQRTALLNAPARAGDSDTLAEVEQRRRQWLAPREERGGDLPVGAELLLTPVVVGLVATIAEKRVWQIVLIVAALFLIVRICILIRRRQRVQEALLDGLCPDCGYECGLSGAGPPVCPECGSAWPLVPPQRQRRKPKVDRQANSSRPRG